MHAAGVMKALLLGKNAEGKDLQEVFGSPTKADDTAGLRSISEVNGDLACQWAKDNVAETHQHLKPYWKCLK